MRILAFETSGATASVALMRDGVLIGEQSLHHTRTHSETIVPMAQCLLHALELSPGDLDALAVDCGPGSFTGLRIGVATANAMAQALGIPVIGIDSLTVMHDNAALCPGPVCCMLDARNESVYAARFIHDGGAGRASRKMDGGLFAGTLEEFLALAPEGALYIGDGALAYEGRLRAQAKGAQIAPERFALCRAGALLSIAHTRLAKNPALMTSRKVAPIYLRPSQAERMWALTHGAD